VGIGKSVYFLYNGFNFNLYNYVLGGKMRQLIMLVAAMLMSSYSVADVQSSGLSKNSPQLNALGSAWKTPQSMPSQKSKNDITMVYGGEDIDFSRKPSITSHTAIA
jgi:hypothetical protein